MAAGRITALFGGVGGSGKTVLSANLAERLRREAGGKTLVFDCAVPFAGGIRDLVGVKELKPLGRILKNIQNLPSGSLLGGYATHSDSFDVDVVEMSGSLDAIQNTDAGQLAAYLALTCLSYGNIVVDAGSTICPLTMAVFDLADVIIVPVVPRQEAVRRAGACLDALRELKYPTDIIRVVVNCDREKAALEAADVARFLKREVSVAFPYAAAALEKAASAGRPVAGVSAQEPFVQALSSLAGIVSESPIRPKNITAATGQSEELGALSMKRREQRAKPQKAAQREPARAAAPEGADGKSAELKQRIHRELINRLDLARINWQKLDAEAERDVRRTVTILVDRLAGHLRSREERSALVSEIMDEALRYGPLEPLLADENIDEIMVNGPNQIYTEVHGSLKLAGNRFASEQQLRGIIERILAPLGHRLDEANPMVDARLPDGSRVNAVIPPLSLTGPVLTIRRFHRMLSVEELYELGSISRQMGEFLRICVNARRNIVVSGGTGSGKTSMLNIMSSFIPENERIVVIEDTSELRLRQEHQVRLESRPPNIEGKGEIAIRDLLRNALRMRPDRIVIGECRGAEALDMLQAMNTGHDGSLTTLHANSARDALSRIETMVLMAGFDLPSRAIREQIASAVHLITQQDRLSDGSRKITKIVEVTGLEGNTVTTQDLFEFKQTGVGPGGEVKGDFVATGLVPTFFDALLARGMKISREMFQRTGF